MSKFLRFMKGSIKYGLYIVGGSAAVGFTYLQFVNTKLGPITIQKDEALKFYKQIHKMSDGQAIRTYYWVVLNIMLARIGNYLSYSSYCQKLNAKIVKPALDNYQKGNIFNEIDKAGSIKEDKKTHIKIFNKIVDIRKQNAGNIETRQYIIKQIRQLQTAMNICALIDIPENNIQKVDKIHNYVCEVGVALRDVELTRYVKKIPEIQKKYPNDYLHKILVI